MNIDVRTLRKYAKKHSSVQAMAMDILKNEISKPLGVKVKQLHRRNICKYDMCEHKYVDGVEIVKEKKNGRKKA